MHFDSRQTPMLHYALLYVLSIDALKHIRQPIQSHRPRALTILLQWDSGRGRVAKEQLYVYNRLASSGVAQRDVVQLLPAADVIAIG